MELRKNPFQNYHNFKVTSGNQKLLKKSQIARYRTGAWQGSTRGIKVLYAIRKKKGPHGGRSQIVSIRIPASWSFSKAKKWVRDHGFKIVKSEKAKKSIKRKNPRGKLAKKRCSAMRGRRRCKRKVCGRKRCWQHKG